MKASFAGNQFILKPEFTDETKRLALYPRSSEDGTRKINNDPDGNRLIEILRSDLVYPEDLKDLRTFHIKKPLPGSPFPGWSPKPWQREPIQNMLTYRHHAIFMEMGLGKTFCTYFTMATLAKRKEASRFLVVCPKRVMPEWVRQHKRMDSERILNVILLADNYSVEQRANMIKLCKDMPNVVFVMNYEAFRKGSVVYNTIAGMPDAKGNPTEEPITFDMVTLDESVKIRYTDTQVSQGLRKLAKHFKRRYILTGLPAPQDFSDYIGQMAFLHPVYFGYNTRDTFIKDFGVRDPWNPNKISSFRNIKKWHERVHTLASVVRKEGNIQLPPKNYVRRVVSMAQDQQQAYDQMANMYAAYVESLNGPIELTAPNVLAKLTRLRQIADGWLCGIKDRSKPLEFFNEDEELPNLPPIPFSSNPKLEALSEMLGGDTPEIDVNESPVVIVASYTHEIWAIMNTLMEHGILTEKIDGEISTARQMEIQDAFDAGVVKALVIQSESGKYGLNLQKAKHLIYFSNSYSYDSRGQSEDRVHRHGQTGNVTIIDLVSEDTIDEVILDTLRDKKNLAEIILHNPRVVTRQDYQKAGYKVA